MSSQRVLRILVVEDNEINQKVIVHILHKLGYEADMVTNGSEAVDAHAQGKYAAILMDCQMPVMDGYAATRMIRGQEQPGNHTPIIAITAHAGRDDRDRCLQSGMDEYLSKPIDIKLLQHTLETWLA